MFFIDILLGLFTLYIVVIGLFSRSYRQIKSTISLVLGVATTVIVFWFEEISKIVIKPIFEFVDSSIYSNLPADLKIYFTGLSYLNIPLVVFVVCSLVLGFLFWLLLSFIIKGRSAGKIFVFRFPKSGFVLNLFLSLIKASLVTFCIIQILLVLEPTMLLGVDASKVLEFMQNYNVLGKVLMRNNSIVPVSWF